MANLNVRIYNKFDTYENWMNSSLILGAGEIAIASIPSGDATGLTPPAIGIKVGEGNKKFSELSWIQATAGDVYGWAKAATKPEYQASEITGLSDYISGEIQDTNTEYSFSIADNYKINVQKKDVNGEYADYQSLDLTAAFNAKADKVTGAVAGNFAGLDANGNLVDSGAKVADFATAAQGAKADSAVQKSDVVTGETNGTIKVQGTEVAVKGLGSAAYTESSAYAPAGHNHDDKYADKTATEAHIANGDIHVTTDDKSKWNTAADKAAANETLLATVKSTAEQGVADAATAQGAAEAAQAAADKAQEEVDALETLVGVLPEGTTAKDVVEYVNLKTSGIATDAALGELQATVEQLGKDVDAIEEDYLVEADKTELQGKIDLKADQTALQGEIDRASGEEARIEGLVTAEAERAAGVEGGLDTRIKAIEEDYLVAADKEALQNQINTIMSNPDAEGAINSINEFTQYVKDHGTVADGFRADIDKNKEDIAANAKAIEDFEAAATGAYATKDELSGAQTTLQGNIDTLAAEVAKKALATDLEGVEGRVDTLEGEMDTAEGKISTLEGKMSTAEGKIEALETKMTTAEGEIDALQADSHTHGNKDVLDGITGALVTDWNDAVAKEHEHSNKAVLDGITSEKVAAWDAAQPNVIESISGVATEVTDKDVKITGVSTDILTQGTETLVFNCGTATTVI